MSGADIRHEWVDRGGVRLHCAVAGAAGRPLLLFLHGFPEFWAAWREPMAYFAARGWLAVAPDLRGYNLSDKPAEVEAYKAKHLVADVLAVAAHYARGKFALVGHDWGGAVAWSVAIAHPGRLARLVMINSPHPYVFWRELRGNPAQRKASEYMVLFRSPKTERVLSENGFARLLSAFGHLPESWHRDLVEAWSRPGALTGGLNYYRASPLYPASPGDPGAARLELEAKDFMVRVPTLVVWGERDTALLTGCLEGLEACVPDLKVVRVPDASHWIVHEKPARVCSEMEQFLKG
ncbi:MAG TPA: alpha/beta hydrolase [Burkholderiales bacterium]|nr:alpha/beta hydrolase [Burkholderiales bacterium]